MAIKEAGNKKLGEIEVTKICAAVSERGPMLCYGSAAGSGASIGATAGTVDLYPNPSGKRPVGVLLVDSVDFDTTRCHQNYYKEVMISGSPVPLLKKGRLTTNNIIGTPAEGDTAYLSSSGNYTPTLHATGGLVATPKVGQFVSIKDENGYATIDFNLPM